MGSALGSFSKGDAMYSSHYSARRGLGSGAGSTVGAAAGTAILGPGIGTAVGGVLGGLFGGAPRLTSGVKKSIYEDEIGDERMTEAIRSGTLAQFIAGTMLAPARTPWGTAYSPESVAWARARLAGIGAASVAQGQTLAQTIAAAASGAAAALLPGYSTPTASAPGAPVQAAGFSPLLIAGVALAGLFYFTRGRRGQ